MNFTLGRVRVRKRNRLPHWDTEGGIYFVTFNLFDAIPAPLRFAIEEDARAQLSLIEQQRGSVTRAEVRAVKRWTDEQLLAVMDAGHGQAFMGDRDVAGIVAGAIEYFDLDRYQLYSWSVMPNHAHVVFSLLNDHDLSETLGAWKGYSGREANRHLRRTVSFWQEDFFDRTIRDERELANTIAYVEGNPASAGLIDWPFAKTYPERLTSERPTQKLR